MHAVADTPVYCRAGVCYICATCAEHVCKHFGLKDIRRVRNGAVFASIMTPVSGLSPENASVVNIEDRAFVKEILHRKLLSIKRWFSK